MSNNNLNHPISLDAKAYLEKVLLSVVPDIESINIGRGVGYDVIEHCPPEEVKNISATKIREQMKKDGKL